MNRQKETRTSTIKMNYPAPYHHLNCPNGPYQHQKPLCPNAENDKSKEKTTKPKKTILKFEPISSGQRVPVNRSWPTKPRSPEKLTRRQKQTNAPKMSPQSQSWAARPRAIPSPLLKYGLFRAARSRSPLPPPHRAKSRVVRIEVTKEKDKKKVKVPTPPPAPAPRLALSNTVHLDIKPRAGRPLVY